MPDLRDLADCYVRPGWTRTVHSSRGPTSDRAIALMVAFRANTVDAASVYAAISRARKGVAIYTTTAPS